MLKFQLLKVYLKIVKVSENYVNFVISPLIIIKVQNNLLKIHYTY